jgi:predicted MPP superfamily phosphohydrolase
MEVSIRNYGAWHRLSEQVQRILMPTDWPARLAVALGARTDVQVERHDLTLSDPLGDASTLRIAFAADFHAGPTTSSEVLRSAARALETEAADLLLLGGDFVSLRAEHVDRVAPLLAGVAAPLGRYAVLGNHDYWAGADRVATSLSTAGIEVLTNRCVRLPAPFGGVSLCGLDDHGSGRPDAAAALSGAGPVKLVLMHAPSSLLDLGPRPFSVAFCGHTHGGQIALPGGRPLVVAHGALSRRYSQGRHDLAPGRTLLVSRGIGCTAVPLRLNSPSAILVCTLRGAIAGGKGA